MKTAAEIDRDGKPLRIFHRRGGMAWTHKLGEKYRYAGGHFERDGLITVECSCRS